MIRGVHLLILLNVLFYGNCKSKKPNILLILADDIGWNDVSFHGSNEIQTPNIDALAYKGLVFDKHYVQQACTPSRAALLTGQYPIKLGYQGTPLWPGENRNIPHNISTLPHSLKKLGYKTHLVGKWHLGHGFKNSTPLAYGFDSHYGYWNGYIGYYEHKISNPTMDGIDFYRNYVPQNESGKYFTDLITNEAIRIINDHNKEEPFFMMLSHLAAHTGKTVAPGHTVLEVDDVENTYKKYFYIKDKNRRLLAEVIEKMDKSIGRVIKTLEYNHLINNTIILFMSDNGAPTIGLHENFGSNWPLRGIKMSLYEGAVRVGAVMYSNLLKESGTLFKPLFHISDWFPTLYRAAGGNPSDLGILDGIDQWNNLISDKQKNIRHNILLNIDEAEHYSGIIGYNGRYKLLNNSWPDDTYNTFLGVSGRSWYPVYKVQNVLESDAYVALSHANGRYGHNSLTESLEIIWKRKLWTLSNCRTTQNPSKCTGICLFNLHSDPCETTNVVEKHSQIVDNLKNLLTHYENALIPQQNTEININADPKFCSGYWFNWMEDAGKGCYFKTH